MKPRAEWHKAKSTIKGKVKADKGLGKDLDKFSESLNKCDRALGDAEQRFAELNVVSRKLVSTMNIYLTELSHLIVEARRTHDQTQIDSIKATHRCIVEMRGKMSRCAGNAVRHRNSLKEILKLNREIQKQFAGQATV